MKTLYGVLAPYSRKIKSVLVIFVFLLSISCNQKQTREGDSTPIKKLTKADRLLLSEQQDSVRLRPYKRNVQHKNVIRSFGGNRNNLARNSAIQSGVKN